MLFRVPFRIGRLSSGFAAALSLSSCGIYGDWVTNIALNHSEQTVVVVAARGANAGKTYSLAPGDGLTLLYGSFSYYVKIRTASQTTDILFDGHLCDGDWILNDNDAILVVDRALKVSCVRLKDLAADRQSKRAP